MVLNFNFLNGIVNFSHKRIRTTENIERIREASALPKQTIKISSIISMHYLMVRIREDD